MPELVLEPLAVSVSPPPHAVSARGRAARVARAVVRVMRRMGAVLSEGIKLTPGLRRCAQIGWVCGATFFGRALR
ncbi:hypothetical protein GCM10009633_20830 [Janibacter melonis]